MYLFLPELNILYLISLVITILCLLKKHVIKNLYCNCILEILIKKCLIKNDFKHLVDGASDFVQRVGTGIEYIKFECNNKLLYLLCNFELN